jgi:hypothetical protein
MLFVKQAVIRIRLPRRAPVRVDAVLDLHTAAADRRMAKMTN